MEPTRSTYSRELPAVSWSEKYLLYLRLSEPGALEQLAELDAMFDRRHACHDSSRHTIS